MLRTGCYRICHKIVCDRQVDRASVAGMATMSSLGINRRTAVPLANCVICNDGGHGAIYTVVFHANARSLRRTRIKNYCIANKVVRNLSLPGTTTVALINIDGTALNIAD